MNPNQMPKKNNKLRQQLLAGLIETKPSSWERKSLSRDEDGKEVLESVKVTHDALRYPLAQNVSDDSVERTARRWL